MIATISGQVQSTQANSLVVDCAGVGYLLHVTPQTSTNAKVGQSIQLYTRLIVREDSMTLYGFDDSDSAELFDAVTGVSGIGPKSGLAIIAALTLPPSGVSLVLPWLIALAYTFAALVLLRNSKFSAGLSSTN